MANKNNDPGNRIVGKWFFRDIEKTQNNLKLLNEEVAKSVSNNRETFVFNDNITTHVESNSKIIFAYDETSLMYSEWELNIRDIRFVYNIETVDRNKISEINLEFLKFCKLFLNI